MRSNPLLLASSLLLLGVAPARADYVPGYSSWHDLSRSAKAGYAAGFLDASVFWRHGDPDNKEETALQAGTASCLERLGYKPSDLARLVDTGYGDGQHTKYSPSFVLVCELRKQCMGDLSKAASALGASPPSPCEGY
jgi:hypothetical protein